MDADGRYNDRSRHEASLARHLWGRGDGGESEPEPEVVVGVMRHVAVTIRGTRPARSRPPAPAAARFRAAGRGTAIIARVATRVRRVPIEAPFPHASQRIVQ